MDLQENDIVFYKGYLWSTNTSDTNIVVKYNYNNLFSSKWIRGDVFPGSPTVLSGSSKTMFVYLSPHVRPPIPPYIESYGAAFLIISAIGMILNISGVYFTKSASV